MPSGSHGGSSGSHFGGGGSHYSGSGGSNSSPRPVYQRGGRSVYIYHIGGRSYYMGTKESSKLKTIFSLFIVCLFSTIILTAMYFGAKSDISTIESDRIYYLDMISVAKQDADNYIVEGFDLTKYQSENCDKYYIEYYFLDGNGCEQRGYTYSIYTLQQASDILYNSYHSIQPYLIALECPQNQSNWKTDSVNLDYENFSLEDDGEYISNLSLVDNLKIPFICVASISGLFLVFTILSLFKGLHKDNGEDKPVQSKTDNEKFDDYTQEKQEEVRRCKYCGSRLKDDENKCEQCGGKN